MDLILKKAYQSGLGISFISAFAVESELKTNAGSYQHALSTRGQRSDTRVLFEQPNEYSCADDYRDGAETVMALTGIANRESRFTSAQLIEPKDALRHRRKNPLA